MSQKIQSIKGMPDVFAPQIELWHYIETLVKKAFTQAGFSEIRTPIVEDLGLFERGIGEATDIVEKEMYTLLDRNEKKLAMRPEGTASVVRAYIEHFASKGEMDKRFYYFGPMFRYERPQKGRFRQFYQFGAEIFGVDEPTVDAELIQIIVMLLKELGVADYTLHINSLGSALSREQYRTTLLAYLNKISEHLCDKCKERKDRNPLRVLDCKNSECQNYLQEAPAIIDCLDEDSKKHFEVFQNYLAIAGIDYQLNPRLVRGLDYYEKTAFEFTSNQLGAQNAFAGGGRYNGLVEQLGGPNIAAIGFAFGMERLSQLLEHLVLPKKSVLLLVSLGSAASEYFFKRLPELRKKYVGQVLVELSEKGLKAKLKYANRLHANQVAILGDDELQKGIVVLKDMQTSEQREVSLDNWMEVFN